jgi:hypothetical protein
MPEHPPSLEVVDEPTASEPAVRRSRGQQAEAQIVEDEAAEAKALAAWTRRPIDGSDILA